MPNAIIIDSIIDKLYLLGTYYKKIIFKLPAVN